MSTHFLLQIYFIKVFSQLLFLFSKIAGMGGIPLWYHSFLWKSWGHYPRFINVFVAFLFRKTPTWLWWTSNNICLYYDLIYSTLCAHLILIPLENSQITMGTPPQTSNVVLINSNILRRSTLEHRFTSSVSLGIKPNPFLGISCLMAWVASFLCCLCDLVAYSKMTDLFLWSNPIDPTPLSPERISSSSKMESSLNLFPKTLKSPFSPYLPAKLF
jgi:hypothetical protein